MARGHREVEPWDRNPLPRGVRVAVWLLRSCGLLFKGLAMFTGMVSIPSVLVAMWMEQVLIWWLDGVLLVAGGLWGIGAAMRFFGRSIEDAHRRLTHGATGGGAIDWPRVFLTRGLGVASDAIGGLGVVLVLYAVVLWIQREDGWLEGGWGFVHVAIGGGFAWLGERLERSAT
ncbi:hypothetical protein llg_29370 [Luteolibacter sp. LG18]|nr:hypothetical protein llg_29370 [Luteolibacter sp. LG18]